MNGDFGWLGWLGCVGAGLRGRLCSGCAWQINNGSVYLMPLYDFQANDVQRIREAVMRSKWYNTGQMVDSHLPLTNRRSERRMDTFSIPPSRTCLDCFVDISDRRYNARLCLSCARERRHAICRQWYQAKRPTRNCLICSVDITDMHGNSSFCFGCAKQANLDIPRLCLDCSVDISERSRSALRCAPCAQERIKAKATERRHTRLGFSNIPTIRFCAVCSADISDRKIVAVYCSSECWHKGTYQPYKRSRYCIVCSIDIAERGTRAVRCVSCSKAHKQTLNRTRYAELSDTAKEERRKTGKAYAARNLDKNRAASQRYRERNREKRRAIVRAWNARNPENRRENVRRYRARKAHQLGSVSNAILDRLNAATKCALCQRRFSKKVKRHLDHILPIAKGGLHEDSNLQALCAKCNQSKNAKDPIAFARRFGRLL